MYAINYKTKMNFKHYLEGIWMIFLSLSNRWLMVEPILDFIVVQMLLRNPITMLILHPMIM